MKSLEELQEILATAFKSLQLPDHPEKLYAPVSYTLSNGGKRLRPLMVLLACDTWSENPDEAVNAAIGIEIFHNFTLLHDDIMDDAPIRRGRETVYKKWNSNIAILSGDAMFALATEYIANSPSGNVKEIIGDFSKIAREVCEGQQYDMDFENNDQVGLCDYLEMIRLKTAVLLAGSLKIGAIIGGANKEDASRIYDFGIQLGLSFQIKDDYLDVFGDENLFGKKIGGDIRARKKTYLYLKALEIANSVQRNELESLYRKDSGNDENVQHRIIDLYLELRIREIAQDEMEKFFKNSLKVLDSLSIAEEKKSRLSVFAGTILNRIH